MAYKVSKALIREKGIGGRDEHWWYLVFNPNDGNFFVQHKRDYVGYKGQSDKREESKMLLSEAKSSDPEIYKLAVIFIRRKLFAE